MCCRFFSNILFSGNMRQTGTRKAREKKYFMFVEGKKNRGEKEMGKASGGQKEEKMKMRKNEHSPKKERKKMD